MTKYIFITGGVVSSLGKGITASVLGYLLKSRELKVTIVKMDPYINVDPGTLNPFEHGEVYVTDDGAETDLDLGHYERFLDIRMQKNNSFSAGQVYKSVIEKERAGKNHGKTVQVIPHITNEIKRRIHLAGKGCDVCLVEVGGTCGDIESLPFIEAIRQLSLDVGKQNALYIHLTLLPYLKSANELKTKPTQNSVKELRAIGVQPDMLICRSEKPINKDLKQKISMYTNVASDCVFCAEDVDNIYSLPSYFAKQELDLRIIKYFGLSTTPDNDLSLWEDIIERQKNSKQTVTIGIIGKYVEVTDAYKSINESLSHAGIRNQWKVEIKSLDAEDIEKKGTQVLEGLQGIIVPGGFGQRGVKGKIQAIEYARTNKIPYLGICFGLQLAVIEFVRNVLGHQSANSTELQQDCKMPIVALVEEWSQEDGSVEKRTSESKMGASMRLGTQSCKIKPNTLGWEIYQQNRISERHRHRYELNNDYIDLLQQGGMILSGTSKDGLIEMIELPREQHPWFFSCQFHPELKSNPRTGHPVFLSFVEAASKHSVENNKR